MDKSKALELSELSEIAYNAEEEAWELLKYRYEKITFFDIKNTQAMFLEKEKEIIIAFRGTKVEIEKAKPKGWIDKIIHWISGEQYAVILGDIRTDLQFKKESAYNSGKIHRGFKAAFEAVKEPLTELIKEKENDDVKIYITGHSLGGALAVILASYLKNLGIKFEEVYTFGQPRVFDPVAAAYEEVAWGDKLHRFINSLDIVPRVPLWLMDFKHFGKVQFFDMRGGFWKDLSFSKRVLIVLFNIITLKLPIYCMKLAFLSIVKDLLKDHDIKKYKSLLESIQE